MRSVGRDGHRDNHGISSHAQNHRSQMPDMKRWAESQELPVQFFRDKFTGRTLDRPRWQRLEKDIRAGKVAKLAVWKIDRLGRTAREMLALFDELRARSVDFVCVAGGIMGLDTPEGRLFAGMLVQFAEYDNEIRAERIRAGQAAAKAQGKAWGGSAKGRRIKVKIEQVRMIQRLHEEGEKISAIARAAGLSRPTIYRLLRDAS